MDEPAILEPVEDRDKPGFVPAHGVGQLKLRGCGAGFQANQPHIWTPSPSSSGFSASIIARVSRPNDIPRSWRCSLTQRSIPIDLSSTQIDDKHMKIISKVPAAATMSAPPITPDSGIRSTPWLPGPMAGTQAPVVVTYTDFRATSKEDLQQIFETGLKLSENWPIMHGAVGLWLWTKRSELRGGSLSIWDSKDDLRRFIGWPVHAAIMRDWRDRIEVLSDTWEDESFVSNLAWMRAEMQMREPRDPSGQGPFANDDFIKDRRS
jgi:hypothetical protein